MAVDIQKIVSLNFNIQKQAQIVSSYPDTMMVCKDDNNVDTAIYDLAEGQGSLLKLKTTLDKAGAKALIAKKHEVSGTAEDFIVVVLDELLATTELLKTPTTDFQEFLEEIGALKAPNRLIVLLSVQFTDTSTLNAIIAAMKQQSITTGAFIGLKVYKQKVDALDQKTNVALATAAYYSKINLDEADAFKDYCFTDENVLVDYLDDTGCSYDDYKSTINFSDSIGSQFVNFGGNLVTEMPISNVYGTICAENDVIFAVLKTMLEKQYLTDDGLTNVVSRIDSALTRYMTNGYLYLGSSYSGETKMTNYNGMKTLLIKQGQTLNNGYIISTIPMSRITSADRQAHKFTPIYVFMETQYGAREIEINGTIIA